MSVECKKVIAFNNRQNVGDTLSYDIGTAGPVYKDGVLVGGEIYHHYVVWTPELESLFVKKVVMLPESLTITLNINFDRVIEHEFRKLYGLTVVLDERDPEFGKLFYNSDLRSYSGYVNNAGDYVDEGYMEIYLVPKYYATGDEDKYFRLLMDASCIMEGDKCTQNC